MKLKTAVTDRTLSYMKYDPEHTSAGALKAYANAVFNCGADYMEVNTRTASLMALDDYSDKYMLTINSTFDCGFCTSNPFAYAVVPFSKASFIDFLPQEQPIIIEINADEYSAPAVILFLHSFDFIRRVSAIRITGLFGDSIDTLVKWCRANLFLPVDICPLNTMMTGASDAIIAQNAGASMLTLSFGRGYYFTALEQYIISLNITRRTVLHKDVIKAICIASFIFTDLFSVIPAGLARMLDTDGEVTGTVYDLESGVLYRPYRAMQRPPKPQGDSLIDRKIKSIGLEHEIETAIIDMLKKVNFSFYKEITKRNLID
ncbi:MAG: hypothetical protein IJ784_05025 [Ruminiclostridium sp.]|nr:hypothetical protein [Ruminiclostridium sp.]